VSAFPSIFSLRNFVLSPDLAQSKRRFLRSVLENLHRESSSLQRALNKIELEWVKGVIKLIKLVYFIYKVQRDLFVIKLIKIKTLKVRKNKRKNFTIATNCATRERKEFFSQAKH
jgi:hypothetical protein